MALPEVRIRVSANTDQAEARIEGVTQDLGRMGAAADRATDTTRRLGSEMTRLGSRGGSMGRGIQNAAFQVGDFAVQVGAGTDASRALAMQLPQLLGGFGALGAVAGASVAILIPLRSAMSGLADDGRDVTQVFGTLQPVAQAVADAMGRVRDIVIDAAELIVNNIDRIITIGATAATFFAGRWVAAFIAARVATFSLSASLVALRGALIRTGFGAAIIAAGELVYQFTRLSQAAGGFGQAIGLLKDVAVETFSRIGYGVDYLQASFAAMAAGMQSTFLHALGTMMGAFVDFTQDVATGINSLFGTNLRGLGQTMTAGIIDARFNALDALDAATGRMASSREGLTAPLESVQKIRDLLAGMKDENITLDSVLFGGDGEGAGGGGKSPADKLEAEASRIEEALNRIRDLTRGSLSDQLGAWGGYFGNLASLVGTNNQKILGLQKAFASAQALMDAYSAYNKVLADPTLPWWARIPAAANVLAAGIGTVNAIRSIGSGGGGAGAAPTGGGVATQTTAPQTPLEVRLQGLSAGQLLDGADVGSLLERLNDEAGDRGFRILVAQ